MTNAAIIENRAFQLMKEGKISGSGKFGFIENEDGTREEIEFPEAIHTFQYWLSVGRSVKKGEKAVDSFCIWKHTTKMLDENTGNEENDKMNALINAKGGQKDMFMQKASFFTFAQTEPTADREKRMAEKKAAKAEKKAKQEEAPKAEAEPERGEQPEPAPAEPEAMEAVTPHYYEINEKAAADAKRMGSFDDYKAGSATNDYRAEIDRATEILKDVKAKCKTQDQKDHAEYIYDKYCKVLASAINKDNEIGTRCPSIMIAGGSNFPVRKKEKQVAAWDANRKNFDYADELLNKLRRVCYQSVRSDDPEVIEVLKNKLVKLEAKHEELKRYNAEARKNGTEPLPWYTLPYNLDAIKRTRARLEKLEAVKEDITEETELYRYEENAEDMRIRFYFDGKPEPETIKALKENGFRWAPSVKAWQRQLTDNGKYAATRVKKLLEAV